VDLPSFLWLWRIAAWSMGLAIVAYLGLGISGSWIWARRQAGETELGWLSKAHNLTGGILVALVLLLLAIGIVGTLGHYGNLAHSAHLPAGIAVVLLVLLSAGSAAFITPESIWMRSLHVGVNIAMLLGLIWVSWTGWEVVQKYL
jgi:hypothetical protein